MKRRLEYRYIVGFLIMITSLTAASGCEAIQAPENLTPSSDDSDLSTITAQAENLPLINEFYADPDSYGGAYQPTLYWDVSEATSVSIEPGVGDVALSGNTPVYVGPIFTSPEIEDVTFTLTATNDAGSVTASTIIYNSGVLAGTIEWESPKSIITWPEPPEQPGVMLIDLTEETPTMELAEELDAIPPPLMERTGAELSGDAPLIYRFEAEPNMIPYGENCSVQVFFRVRNAPDVHITWSSDTYSETTILRTWGWNAECVYYNSREGNYFYFWVPGSWRSNIDMILTATGLVRSGSEWVSHSVTESLTIQIGTRTIEAIEPSVSPVIFYFYADPTDIRTGERSTLSWEVVNADSVAILGGDTVIRDLPFAGSIEVTPAVTTHYYLNAQKIVDDIPRTRFHYTTVNVIPTRPTIHSFAAEPESITAGDMSRLSWEVLRADSVTITSVDFTTADLPLTGSIHVSPTENRSYRLLATNAAGIVDEEVTITVEEPSPPSPPKVLKPDLVIKDMWQSGTNQCHYVIENQGEEDSKASTTALMIDGEPHTSHEIGSLAAGESREVYFTYSYSCVAGTSHSWQVVADADNDIDESNEANNSYTAKFICSK